MLHKSNEILAEITTLFPDLRKLVIKLGFSLPVCSELYGGLVGNPYESAVQPVVLWKCQTDADDDINSTDDGVDSDSISSMDSMDDENDNNDIGSSGSSAEAAAVLRTNGLLVRKLTKVADAFFEERSKETDSDKFALSSALLKVKVNLFRKLTKSGFLIRHLVGCSHFGHSSVFVSTSFV